MSKLCNTCSHELTVEIKPDLCENCKDCCNHSDNVSFKDSLLDVAKVVIFFLVIFAVMGIVGHIDNLIDIRFVK